MKFTNREMLQYADAIEITHANDDPEYITVDMVMLSSNPKNETNASLISVFRTTVTILDKALKEMGRTIDKDNGVIQPLM